MHTDAHERTRTGPRTHAHEDTHTHAHARTHARTDANTHAHTHTHARTHARTHAHARTHTHAHARTHTHAHARTHTHARTRTHLDHQTRPCPHPLFRSPPPKGRPRISESAVTSRAAAGRHACRAGAGHRLPAPAPRLATRGSSCIQPVPACCVREREREGEGEEARERLIGGYADAARGRHFEERAPVARHVLALAAHKLHPRRLVPHQRRVVPRTHNLPASQTSRALGASPRRRPSRLRASPQLAPSPHSGSPRRSCAPPPSVATRGRRQRRRSLAASPPPHPLPHSLPPSAPPLPSPLHPSPSPTQKPGPARWVWRCACAGRYSIQCG